MTAISNKAIQSAIAGLYPNITLPHGFGTITALTVEPDGEFTALPAVVVFRQPTESIVRESGGTYLVTRQYIARLYVEKMSNNNPLPSVDETLLGNVADCIEVVEDYFNLTDSRLGNTDHIQKSWIEADTGDTRLQVAVQGKNTSLYGGVAFRHVVQYRRWKA